MIWLLGRRGMLGREVETLLRTGMTPHLATGREVDVTDREALQAFVAAHPEAEIDWIINCTGYTAVDRAEQEPRDAYRVNAEGARNIAGIARQLSATMIHISTDYIYDGSKGSPYTEEDLPRPIGVYGQSKLKGEQAVCSTLRKYFIIRTAWLYGKHQANFVSTMLRLFHQRDEIAVVSDQWGNPTFARDLACTVLGLVRENRREYGIYHYTNKGCTNWCDFAREIYAQATKQGILQRAVSIQAIAAEQYPTKARRPKYTCLSKDKIINTFGIDIRSWQEALREFLSSIGDDTCAA